MQFCCHLCGLNKLKYFLVYLHVSFKNNMDFVHFLLSFISITEITPIIDILKHKQVSNVFNINCNSQAKSGLLFHKILNDNNIQAASIDVNYKTASRMPDYYHNKVGIVINTSCYNWIEGFNYFPSKIAFKYQFTWLIITDDLVATTKKLSNYSIEIDSDVTIILKKKSIFELFEVYYTNYPNIRIFNISKVGFWNRTLYMDVVPRRDISGVVIKSPVVIIDKVANETFEQYLTRPKKNQVDSLHKLKFFALLIYMRDMYQFRYELRRTNSWGYTRNNTFDGIVGCLQRNEADIGGSPLFFRADRAEFLDYIAETWQSRQCFILRHPKHPGGFYSIYTRPLTPQVWACVLTMLGVAALILCCMLKTKTPHSGLGQADSSFSLSLLFSWSALCQQGMSVQRCSTSVKIVVLVIFIYAMTLYQYYNATVVSTLLREPPKNIRNLEDLLRTNMKAGAEDVLYTKDFFKRTTDPIATKMYFSKIVTGAHRNFLSAERGMALVNHVDSVVAYRIMKSTFTEREICEAHEVLLYPPQKMGFVVRKHSPYKEHFAYGIRKLAEAGLLKRLQAEWDERRPACVRTPDASVFSVSLREFAAALLALAGGGAAAALVLAGELLLHWCGERKRIAFTH